MIYLPIIDNYEMILSKKSEFLSKLLQTNCVFVYILFRSSVTKIV